jgi:riboflavin kinase/FMN adenylyltransferase
MRIARSLDQVPPAPGGRTLAIGNFDGVHLGHRKIVEAAVERARAAGEESTVITFEPHPKVVLRPEEPRDMLTTFEDKAEQFRAMGVDLTLCLTFDREFAAQSPEAFVRSVLVPLGAREVFVGANYRFGHDRKGDAGTLTELGQRHGFAVYPQSFFSKDGQRVSSSRVRTALKEGDVAEARDLLGRPYCLKGQVVPGVARGREMGFPTANLNIPEELVPANGVYAARAAVSEPSEPGEAPEPDTRWYDAAVYIGTRPTFAAHERLIEVHLLDTRRELYGHRIRIDFVDRVRPEMVFAGPAELSAQIGRDVARARSLLAP